MRRKYLNNILACLLLGPLMAAGCSHDKDDVPSQQPSTPTTPSAGDIDITFPFDYVNGRDNRSLLQGDSYSRRQKDSLYAAFSEALATVESKRGKVVTAATFLVTLDYRIPYGFEWKITDSHDYDYVGRYTKKGLFLDEFTESGALHKPWGALIPTHPRYPRQNVQDLGDYYENGLHCSSFVAWALYNGEAVTDVALLEKTYANDYRTFPNTTEVTLKGNADLLRPGDLIGFPGHIAIVIGVKGNIVVYASAEGGSSYPGKGISWLTFNKRTVNYDTFSYKYFIRMNNVYRD